VGAGLKQIMVQFFKQFMALGALTMAGCVELPLPAQEKLKAAEHDYRSRDYRAATTKLDDVLRVYPEYKQSAEAYYLRAECRIATNNKLGAASDLKKCISLSNDPVLASDARASAGTLAFEAGNFSEAVAYYEEALKKAKETPPTDQIRYNDGVALMRLGDWRRARVQFGMVSQRYPSSPLAANARDKFEWPFDYFVIQCGVFRDKAAANKQSGHLQGTGLATRVESRQRSGETIYMVCVGSYPKYDLAVDALRSIKGKCAAAVIVPGL
jgi:tetratricopeptide (TPR) repeat protein